MMTSRRWLALAIASAAFTLAPPPMLHAADSSTQNAPRRANPLAPVDHTPSARARQEAADAQAAIARAEATINTVTTERKAGFQAGADLKAARAALATAQKDLDAARAAIVKSLQANPEYAAARARQAQTEAERDRLAEAGRGSAAHLAAVQTALNAASDVVRRETSAFAADPKVADAKSRVAQANARLHELDEQIKQAIATDPKIVAARKQIEENRAKLSQANARLEATTRNEAAAEDQRRQRLAEAERRRQNTGKRRTVTGQYPARP